jgi:hypothetical protein
MMDIQIVDPTKYPGWDELVLQHPEATIFHSSGWARVLSETYRYTPVYFVVLRGNTLSAMLPVMEVKSLLTGTRGVSLPFTDYCEPITDQGISSKDLLDRVIDFGKNRRWKYIEIRGGFESRESQVASREGSNSVNRGSARGEGSGPSSDVLRLAPDGSSSPSVSYLGHIVELGEDTEEVFYGFKDFARRNIRKANREGVETGIFTTPDSVMEFYRLNCLTRREHGLPPQPYSFFNSIYQHMISKDRGVVVLASCKGKYIAGGVFFHFGALALYKYGASDRRHQHLRANNLVMWEAIKWYCQKGYKSLCLGRTEPENEGLLRFKSGWGPSEYPINYYRYDFKKRAFVSGFTRTYGFHNKIFRNISIPVLNRIGPLFYRHAG